MSELIHDMRKPNLDSLKSLIIVVRHGDRSPVFNPFENHEREAEYERIWREKVVVADLPNVVNANESTFDRNQTFPFGILTQRGVDQACSRGLHFANRYNGLKLNVHSAQTSNYHRVFHTLSVISESFGLSNVQISVPPAKECPVGVFENKELMKLMFSVYQSKEYMELEKSEEVYHISRTICEHVPYFNQSGYGDTDSGKRFLWILAADLFTASRSHCLSLSGLTHLESSTHQHLLRRMKGLFSLSHMMKNAIGPLVKDIHTKFSLMNTDIPKDVSNLALYGGHDITLLPLLSLLLSKSDQLYIRYDCGDKKNFVRKDSELRQVSSDGLLADSVTAPTDLITWPRYCSAISIELHGPDGEAFTADHVRNPNWYIRWFFDNEELNTVEKPESESEIHMIWPDEGAESRPSYMEGSMPYSSFMDLFEMYGADPGVVHLE